MSGWISRAAACVGFFLMGIITGLWLIPAQSPAVANPAAHQTASSTDAPAAVEVDSHQGPESGFSGVLDRLDERIASLDPEPAMAPDQIQCLIDIRFADAPAALRDEWTEQLRGMSLEDAEFLLEQRNTALGGAAPLIMQASCNLPKLTESANRPSAEHTSD